MTRMLFLLLALLVSMSGKAIEVNGDFSHSTLAAEGGGTAFTRMLEAGQVADRGGLTVAVVPLKSMGVE